MVDAKRMMETDENGIKRQFFPITHFSAILGLSEIMNGQAKVLSVNGKTGAVIITRADLDLPSDGIMISQQEYDKMLKIIADYEAGKLGGSGVEFEKVKGDEEINAWFICSEKDGVAIDVQTSTAGVVGLNEFVDGKISGAEAGTVSSVNGHTGEVVLTASDVKALPDTTIIPTLPGNATSEKDGLMSKSDKEKLDALPVFTFEKVGEA